VLMLAEPLLGAEKKEPKTGGKEKLSNEFFKFSRATVRKI
jgi:hypothetical protein